MSTSQFVTRQARRILVCALLAALCLPGAASAAPLPDLISNSAASPNLVVDTSGTTSRLLLRFDGFVHNIGHGALEIRGSAPTGSGFTTRMSTVQQVVKGVAPGEADQLFDVPAARMLYENSDGHNHFHFMDAAVYSLWNNAATAMVAPSQKVGFCMMDSQWQDPSAYQDANGNPATVRTYDEVTTEHCQMNHPEATSVHMGISFGYRDVYSYWLPYQWVDVSDVQPGVYQLRSHVDPDDRLQESDETNLPSDTQIRVKGYVAEPQTLVRNPRQARTITLSAQSFEPMAFDDPVPPPLGAPEYAIVSQPQHGTVSLAGNLATYTPAPGPARSDSFRFSVREAGSTFPRTPAVATVSLGSAVAIGGAPGRVTAGKSVQLSATGSNITWSVNGLDGGDAAAGTIAQDGLYTAPAAVPADPVSVRARSSVSPDAFDEAQLTIVAEPVPMPAPMPAAPRVDTPVTTPRSITADPPFAKLPTSRALGSVTASRVGPQLVVATRPGRNGSLRITIRRGSRRIAWCTVKVKAGTQYVCRMRPRGHATRARLDVTVTLREANGRTTTRKTRLKAASAKASGHGHAGHQH